MTVTRESLAAALRELAEAGPENELRRLGIRGVPYECHRCPIARYLVRHFGVGPESVTVDCDTVTVCDVTVDAPPEITHFVDRFDYGSRPEFAEGGAK